MSFFSQRITLFWVLGILVIVLSIPYAVYYIQRDVTGMVVGALVVIILLAIVVLALDRLALRFLKPLWLSVVELAILIASLMSYSYSNRSVILDLSANPSPYFVVIWTKYQPDMLQFQRRFLLDRIATVPTGTVALLHEEAFPLLDLRPPGHWQGQFSRGVVLTDSRFASAYFYGPEEFLNKTAEVDSLLRAEVARQP